MTGQDTILARKWSATVGGAVTEPSFSTDGRRLVATLHVPSPPSVGGGQAPDPCWVVWDRATGQERLRLAGGGKAALSPDGHTLIQASEGPGGASRVQAWDLQTGRPARLFQDPQGRVAQLVYSSDGMRLAAVVESRAEAQDRRHGVHVWDADDGRTQFVGPGLQTAQDGGILWTALAFRPDGTQLMAVWITPASSPAVVRKCWDTATQREQEIPALEGESRSFSPVWLSPDGLLLAMLGEDRRFPGIRLWDLRSGQLVSTLQLESAPERSLRALQFVPDSSRIITHWSGAAPSLWDVATGLEILSLDDCDGLPWGPDRYSEVTLSSDGKMLAEVGHGTLTLWTVEEPTLEVATGLPAHPPPPQ